MRMHKLLDMATPVLLNIFLKRWTRLMELEQQNNNINWVDGRECGERVFKICTDNAIPITVPEEIIRDGHKQMGCNIGVKCHSGHHQRKSKRHKFLFEMLKAKVIKLLF